MAGSCGRVGISRRDVYPRCVAESYLSRRSTPRFLGAEIVCHEDNKPRQDPRLPLNLCRGPGVLSGPLRCWADYASVPDTVGEPSTPRFTQRLRFLLIQRRLPAAWAGARSRSKGLILSFEPNESALGAPRALWLWRSDDCTVEARRWPWDFLGESGAKETTNGVYPRTP